MAVGLAVGLTLGVAGAAFAYWTTTGVAAGPALSAALPRDVNRPQPHPATAIVPRSWHHAEHCLHGQEQQQRSPRARHVRYGDQLTRRSRRGGLAARPAGYRRERQHSRADADSVTETSLARSTGLSDSPERCRSAVDDARHEHEPGRLRRRRACSHPDVRTSTPKRTSWASGPEPTAEAVGRPGHSSHQLWPGRPAKFSQP